MNPLEGIKIGVRAGVVWTCWREPGESLQRWQARAERMREAFEAR